MLDSFKTCASSAPTHSCCPPASPLFDSKSTRRQTLARTDGTQLSVNQTTLTLVRFTSCSGLLLVDGAMVRQKGPAWSAVVPAERHFTACTMFHATWMHGVCVTCTVSAQTLGTVRSKSSLVAMHGPCAYLSLRSRILLRSSVVVDRPLSMCHTVVLPRTAHAQPMGPSSSFGSEKSRHSSREQRRPAITNMSVPSVTRRKQHRPGVASNSNTTARSSADLTKRNRCRVSYGRPALT